MPNLHAGTYNCLNGPVPNPYPGGGPGDWQEITNVQTATQLILVRCKGGGKYWSKQEFIVGHAYTVEYWYRDNANQNQGPCQVIVPCGMVTDLISMPGVLRKMLLMRKLGPHAEACAVHDYLYGAQKTFVRGNHKKDRLFADDLLKLMMERAGVGRFKRWVVYRGLRLLAGNIYKKAINKFVGNRCFCDDPLQICTYCNDSMEMLSLS